MKTEKKRIRLKRRLIEFMVFVWLLPMELLFLGTFFSYRESNIERTERLIREGVNSASILTASRLDEAIRLMEKPSYEKSWETYWKQYREGKISQASFYVLLKNTLKKSFYVDDRFDSYAFYLDETGKGIPLFFFSRQGESSKDYLQSVQPSVQSVINRDSNYVEVHIINNKVYLVRNLYTITDYKRYGSLVVSLNTEKLTDGYPMEVLDNVVISLNGTKELFYLGEPDQSEEAKRLYGNLMEAFSPDARGQVMNLQNGKYRGYMYQKKCDKYSIGFYYIVHDRMISANQQNWIAWVISVLLVLMTFYAIRFLRHQIEEPLDWMVEGSKKMEKGAIGTKVEVDPMPNEEFAYLATSFNDMSEQVKHLFDTVYNEQIARKDAQIAALQAQINPHFLNNTLEMMNWQARMNEDLEVCKMIESLSIVLDHSINRNNEKTIYLSEELRCADAYLYIMSMRFGQRLKVEKEIDEELLRNRVPQLILQPLIENAIIHGIETVRQGTIWLQVHHDEQCIYVDVINTGKEITKENREKIERILDGTYEPDAAERGKHTSIGIRNVNRRIKLVYGEEYGLTITAQEDGRTLSRICMPYIQIVQDNV